MSSSKRTFSETFQVLGDIASTALLKQRRLLSYAEEPVKESRREVVRRVCFATPLVQQTVIPSVQDQAEKERLFYSDNDFARFALNERVRRDALILTVTLCEEQQKRLRRGANAIPVSSIQTMYNKVFTRAGKMSRADDGQDVSETITRSDDGNKNTRRRMATLRRSKSRIAVARCA